MKNTIYLIVIQIIASLRGNRDPPDGSKLALHQAEQKLYVAIKERELANSIGLKNASNKQKIAKGTMLFLNLQLFHWHCWDGGTGQSRYSGTCRHAIISIIENSRIAYN